MRTTLNIADDVLLAAKELARRERKTAGQVLSELARRALGSLPSQDESEELLGFRPFPSRGTVVTDELINQLRGEGPY